MRNERLHSIIYILPFRNKYYYILLCSDLKQSISNDYSSLEMQMLKNSPDRKNKIKYRARAVSKCIQSTSIKQPRSFHIKSLALRGFEISLLSTCRNLRIRYCIHLALLVSYLLNKHAAGFFATFYPLHIYSFYPTNLFLLSSTIFFDSFLLPVIRHVVTNSGERNLARE